MLLQDKEEYQFLKYLKVKDMAATIKITLKRSPIKRVKNQKLTLEALGLTKLNKTVEHNVTPQIMGMVAVVKHLVTVEE